MWHPLELLRLIITVSRLPGNQYLCKITTRIAGNLYLDKPLGSSFWQESNSKHDFVTIPSKKEILTRKGMNVYKILQRNKRPRWSRWSIFLLYKLEYGKDILAVTLPHTVLSNAVFWKPYCDQSLIMALVKILLFRPPTQLIRNTNYMAVSHKDKDYCICTLIGWNWHWKQSNQSTRLFRQITQSTHVSGQYKFSLDCSAHWVN